MGVPVVSGAHLDTDRRITSTNFNVSFFIGTV
jgi:hypothetical protein